MSVSPLCRQFCRKLLDAKELEALFKAVGEGVRFKPSSRREKPGACRRSAFANVDDEKR